MSISYPVECGIEALLYRCFNVMYAQRLKKEIIPEKERPSSYKHIIKRMYTYTKMAAYFLFISKIAV
jgi:hypothetical protein